MRKHGMKACVAEIKAENAAKCEMSKEEYRAYLIAAMKTGDKTLDAICADGGCSLR